MKIYIYTIPKAGTYFLADFIGRLGYNNTGYHVSKTSVLNTKMLDLKTNSQYPARAKEQQFFIKTLRQMKDRDVVFGHFPAPLLGWLFPDIHFICAYRHPKKTLASEFIDFRFRRKDMSWINSGAIESDQEAFCLYLERHGSVHMAIFSQMLGVTMLRNAKLCTQFPEERFYMLNFETLLKDSEEPNRLASFLDVDPKIANDAIEETRASDTKTKATDIEIDRDALWSDRAEELYHNLNADSYVRRARELGWSI